MRFGVPRSPSPSPERDDDLRHEFLSDNDGNYSSSSYTSSDSESDDSTSDAESSSSYDSSSSSSSASQQLRRFRLKRLIRPPASPKALSREQRAQNATVASIRKYTRANDEYDDWKRETRESAFTNARRAEIRLVASQDKERQNASDQLCASQLGSIHDMQLAEVQQRLNSLELARKEQEAKLRKDFAVRDQELWKRIEEGIKVDQDKVQAKLDAERKRKEEEEAKRKEQEMRQRLLEEKRKAAEEKKRQEEEEKKRKAEEETRKAEELQRQEAESKAAAEAQRKATSDAHDTARQAVGFDDPKEEWSGARKNLQKLKAESIRPVKANREAKSLWGKLRRQIVPKVGQLTNDQSAIDQISSQLFQLVSPSSGPHPPSIFRALLSSLAKAILLQAETEVTATKLSATPLARVAFNILTVVPEFANILFAKLVQRVGIWAIPLFLPNADADGRPWKGKDEIESMWGYRKGEDGAREAEGDYVARIAGVMRVYFEILKISPTREPLDNMFRTSRAWVWTARIVSDSRLLQMGVCAEILFTALDVLGEDLLRVYGRQWVKMLMLIHEGATKGYEPGKRIGGDSTEGKSGRARLTMAIEGIMSTCQPK